MNVARRARRVVAFAAGLMAVALIASPVAAAGPSVWVAADGLDNPRGIAVGADGRVFVAEAGTGAAGSGRITVIDRGSVRTFAAGLPSAVSPESDVSGPTNVALNARGNVAAVIGGGPQQLDPRFDSVLRLDPGGTRYLGNVQAFVNAHPDQTDIDQPPNPTDSNAYGAAWVDSAETLVTDAANNTLLLVGPNHRVQMVAKFPNELVSTAHLPFPAPPMLPAESVPTSVAIGPDGFAYVGELKGFPFTPGASRIWRVDPWARNVTCDPAATSGPCTLFMDGLTSITGLDFGPDGSLYAVSIVKNGLFGLFGGGGDTTGALWKISDGTVTELIPGQLTLPGDVAVARNGTIYVTNGSIFTGGGQVIAIQP
ncbi:MAG: ScyD/ScyE family protein [Chloroflexota bacterium]|nr:ScyD/ScyE family protein [Chloroflexota bacterium]